MSEMGQRMGWKRARPTAGINPREARPPQPVGSSVDSMLVPQLAPDPNYSAAYGYKYMDLKWVKRSAVVEARWWLFFFLS